MITDKKIKTGSDFCGVGAFDQAIERLGIVQDKKFACDWDKFARQTYILNYGEPAYFPQDVYDREIPKESLDIYMTSPPCQAFSNAGNRLGEDDERGILFYNSHEFIEVNKPRFFIFENVKGLISHDKGNPKDDMGRTFRRWLDYLGGKSVNGNTMMFPHPRAVPYHIYYFVLNAKEHNIPQNRERVFIVGIRDDKDNKFDIPKTEPLKKFLKDCLEDEVDEKYFLSKKQIKSLAKPKSNFNGKFEPFEENEPVAKCITTNAGSRHTDNFLIIKANTKKGYEVLNEGDSINLSVPSSKTRRGRIGKGVAQTLDTQCNQGVLVYSCAVRGRGKKGQTIQSLEINKTGLSNAITTVEKDNLLMIDNWIRKFTPRECFRLMDFPDSFKWNVSDRQAYKQAGNSIPVGLLVKIIKKLKL